MNANVYSLSHTFHRNQDSRFELSNDGVLTLVGRLDFEETTEYEIVITASDGGDPKLSADATVKVCRCLDR